MLHVTGAMAWLDCAYRLIRYQVGFLFQSECIFCGTDSWTQMFCYRCNPLREAFWRFQLHPVAFVDKVTWLCDLNPLSKKFIYLVKYHSKREILEEVKEHFTNSLEGVSFVSDILVPVPLHSHRFWKRGFNQSEVIARWLENVHHIPVSLNCLTKYRNTASQGTLSKQERGENLKECFLFVNRLGVRKVLLIDDIFTTGQTLSFCAQAMKEKGVEEVEALCLFRTPRNKKAQE